MDRLKINKPYECYCGTGSAFDFACSYILENSDKGTNVTDSSGFKVAVVSDRAVSGYYYNEFENQFIVRGIRPTLITIDAKDNSKNLKAVDEIIRYLVDFGFSSNDWIIAFGGGGIIDVAGVAAGLYEAGVRLMLVPTTLNAMVEGSLSSRGMINVTGHKDCISCAYEPNVVFIDPTFLKTVPRKITFNGYASIIRYAVLGSPDLLSDLGDVTDPGFKGNPGDSAKLREYLEKVFEIRSSLERSNPVLLTLGDEISLAIESYFRFMNYSQGEALALSILSSMPKANRAILENVYTRLGLPLKLEGVSKNMIIKAISSGLDRFPQNEVYLTDYESQNGGKWAIKKVTKQEALGILSARVDVICNEGNPNG